MTGTWRSWIVVASLLAAGAAPAAAQSTTGTITGRAVDSSGAILPGVAVSITSPQMIGGARDAVTDTLGTYRFTAGAARRLPGEVSARQLPRAQRRRRRRHRQRHADRERTAAGRDTGGVRDRHQYDADHRPPVDASRRELEREADGRPALRARHPRTGAAGARPVADAVRRRRQHGRRIDDHRRAIVRPHRAAS